MYQIKLLETNKNLVLGHLFKNDDDTWYFGFVKILFGFFLKFVIRKCFHSIFLSYANRRIKMHLYVSLYIQIR